MVTYRVQKGNETFYVQPEQLDYYEYKGYTIYKTVEQEVTDVASEMASAGTEKVIQLEA